MPLSCSAMAQAWPCAIKGRLHPAHQGGLSRQHHDATAACRQHAALVSHPCRQLRAESSVSEQGASNCSGSGSGSRAALLIRNSSSGGGGGSSPNRKKGRQQQQQQEKEEEEHDQGGAGPSSAKLAATLGVAGGLAVLVVGGVLLKEQIKMFLDVFIELVDRWGPAGYAAYGLVYAGLELLAVPAIPLTMTAGIIFGILPGTAVVSLAGTLAATGAFLIARYVARDRVADWAQSNPKFAAIDRAIGKDGLRVVALLRLSPLLPLAASNYLYGLTSVELSSYVLGSWLGMLPGTLAYVAAGTYGRDFFLGGEGVGAAGAAGGGVQYWQVAVGLAATGLAVVYVGRLAKQALEGIEEEGEEL